MCVRGAADAKIKANLCKFFVDLNNRFQFLKLDLFGKCSYMRNWGYFHGQLCSSAKFKLPSMVFGLATYYYIKYIV